MPHRLHQGSHPGSSENHKEPRKVFKSIKRCTWLSQADAVRRASTDNPSFSTPVAEGGGGGGEQDARQKEVMAGLKQEVANLTRLVEAGAGLTLGQESAVTDLLKQKEELQREHDAQVRPLPSPHYVTTAQWKRNEKTPARSLGCKAHLITVIGRMTDSQPPQP